MITCLRCNYVCPHAGFGYQCGCQCPCETETTEVSYTSAAEANGLTTQEYQEYLCSTLSLGSCIPNDLCERIKIYWMLNCQIGCGDLEYTYLLTRIQTIFSLLSCAAFGVDKSSSISESNNRTTNEAKTDSESQAQGTQHSSSYADAKGISSYEDLATSILRSFSSRTARSSSADSSSTVADDIGTGASENVTTGDRSSESSRVAQDRSQASSETVADGERRGFDYVYSETGTGGLAPVLSVLAQAGVSFTGKKAYNTSIMRSDSYNSTVSSRTGESQKCTRSNSEQLNQSRRVSSSHFNAIIDSLTCASSQSQASDVADATSDSSSQADGKGQAHAENYGKGQSSSQQTQKSLSESEAETIGDGHSYTISDSTANGQVFDHLKMLYVNATHLLNEYLTIRAANRGISIGCIITQSRDGFCPIGAIEKYLCLPGNVYGYDKHIGVTHGHSRYQ